MAAQDLYKMGTISKLTGLSPEVLRAWERRHGFLDPERGDGGHRRYTEDDLAVLRRVVALLGEGRSIGEIALRGRRGLLEEAQSEAGQGPLSPERSSSVDRWIETIVAGALAMDSGPIEEALDEAFGALTPERVLSCVIGPAAHSIGELWEAGRLSVAGEHLASALFSRRVRGLLGSSAVRRTGPLVVAACVPDELHELGGLVLAYHLGRAGAAVTWLGAALPFEDLEAALHRLAPEAVYLSVTQLERFHAVRDDLSALMRRWANVRWVVGGQGVPAADSELEQLGCTLWQPERPASELASDLRESQEARKSRGRRSNHV